MPILIARFSDGAEFLDRHLPKLGKGGLFQPTRKPLEVGSTVVLDVRMPLLKDTMLLRGTVAYRQRGRRGTGQRAGLGIELERSEIAKLEHLLGLARGDTTPASAQRRYRRLPVQVPVRWRVPNTAEQHKSTAFDISTGGVFIKDSPAAIPAGSALIVDVEPPGPCAAQRIEGRVAWTSDSGFGIEFRCRDIGGLQRLRELVRRIEQSPEMQ